MATIFDYIICKYIYGDRIKIPTQLYQIHNSVINIQNIEWEPAAGEVDN